MVYRCSDITPSTCAFRNFSVLLLHLNFVCRQGWQLSGFRSIMIKRILPSGFQVFQHYTVSGVRVASVPTLHSVPSAFPLFRHYIQSVSSGLPVFRHITPSQCCQGYKCSGIRSILIKRVFRILSVPTLHSVSVVRVASVRTSNITLSIISVPSVPTLHPVSVVRIHQFSDITPRQCRQGCQYFDITPRQCREGCQYFDITPRQCCQGCQYFDITVSQ